jgi:hypothetical protein
LDGSAPATPPPPAFQTRTKKYLLVASLAVECHLTEKAVAGVNVAATAPPSLAARPGLYLAASPRSSGPFQRFNISTF